MPAHFLSALGVAALVGWLFVGCARSDADAPLTRRESGSSPAYNTVWGLGTHNSYWVERTGGDPFALGPRERILDQLLADRVRALELDIHRSTPHTFRVYHGIPGDSLCDTLAECLALVRTFHRTVSDHIPLVVIIEFKELFRALFDDDHTPADLDQVLADGLGAALYRPAELFAPCEGHGIDTLAECTRRIGWPSIAELRGRVLVAVLGNWDMFGARNTDAFVRYATETDIRTRAAFPMFSSWLRDWSALDPNVQQWVTADALHQAYAQSLFIQSEQLNDPRGLEDVDEGRVSRINNAFTISEQESAVKSGLQILQTDTPWLSYQNRGPQLPIGALSAAIPESELRESSNIVVLGAEGDPQQEEFASTRADLKSSATWEAVVSSGPSPSRIGCLRAASARESAAENSVSLCREVLPGDAGPDAAGQILRVTVCQNSICTDQEWKSADRTMGGPGEILSLHVQIDAGQSCVTLRSARLVDGKLAPIWTPLGSTHCMNADLIYQGVARRRVPTEGGAVYFFNTTRDGTPVSATELLR